MQWVRCTKCSISLSDILFYLSIDLYELLNIYIGEGLSSTLPLVTSSENETEVSQYYTHMGLDNISLL